MKSCHKCFKRHNCWLYRELEKLVFVVEWYHNKKYQDIFQLVAEKCKDYSGPYEEEKAIYNPVTNTYYPIHRRETSEETRKRIKNLWKRRDQK